VLEGRKHNYQDLIDFAEQLDNSIVGIDIEVIITPRKFEGWLAEYINIRAP